MEEMERMRSDIGQLTRRVDDFSLRLAVVESEREGLTDKLDSMKELIELKLATIKGSVDNWNKIGAVLVTVFASAIAIAIVAFVVNGGLKVPH